MQINPINITIIVLNCVILTTIVGAIIYHKNQSQNQITSSELEQLKTTIILEIMQELTKSMTTTSTATNANITNILNHQNSEQVRTIETLMQRVDRRLAEIGGLVENKLTQGFAQTSTLFNDVIERLALVDAAQKKISDLSSHVIDLQALLSNKSARGAFGEAQLEAIVRNLIPASNVDFQVVLSNGKRADCVIKLPPPTGNLVIDAKFPLENFKRLQDASPLSEDATKANRLFRIDIQNHIKAISSKYIIPGETAAGAIMFIPAEAVFATIHSQFPELIDLAHQHRVWLASPTTTMAIVTSAAAVLKDFATRNQVEEMQSHLVILSQDFERFRTRMSKLAKHIDQAHQDVADVHKSSQKITSRFAKIEQVDLSPQPANLEVSEDIVT